MISALPGTPTLEDASAIQAARVAYENLGDTDRAQVDNVNRLLQAEKMLQALQNITGKQTVHVNSKSQFVKALNNPDVGTIITDGATIEFETWNGWEDTYDITRDLRIMGSSKSVSYTHLDVYKRQEWACSCLRPFCSFSMY